MDFAQFKDLALQQRAIRAFDTSRSVDDDLIEQALRVATFAPNGGNRQPVRFVVIRDQAVKDRLAKLYTELTEQYLGGVSTEQTSWREVPVLIAVCSEGLAPRADNAGARLAVSSSMAPASVFPAVQNLLLSLHAQGLGSVLTTLWKPREAEVREALSLPDNVEVHVILPVGWPDRKYGRGKRRPVSEITYRDSYGKPW